MPKLDFKNLKITDFNDWRERNYIQVRRPRLIPSPRTKSEAALTSTFLTALRLLPELREEVLSKQTKIKTRGRLHVYTEVTFPETDKGKELRVDGLIFVEQKRGGKIKDAALVEVKQGDEPLKKEQMESYMELAKEVGISNFITLSNQYVSTPSQSPVAYDGKKSRNMDVYHLSWPYVETMVHNLVGEVDDGLTREILEELNTYFQDKDSGVKNMTSMAGGWKTTADRIGNGQLITHSEDYVMEAVTGWQQLEREIVLLLSKDLGVRVQSGVQRKDYKDDLMKRWVEDAKKLAGSRKRIVSNLKIPHAVSEMTISANFARKAIETTVHVKSPSESTKPSYTTFKGQTSWLCRQLGQVQGELLDNLLIGIKVKGQKDAKREHFSDLRDTSASVYRDIDKKYKGKTITEFEVIYCRNLRIREFTGKENIVRIVKGMVVEFYSNVVQELSEPVELPPQSVKSKEPPATEADESTDSLPSES